jgi:hypothetical protein
MRQNVPTNPYSMGTEHNPKRGFALLKPKYRKQAISLKFRLLSIHFTSEPFEKVRKMSAIEMLRQPLSAGF